MVFNLITSIAAAVSTVFAAIQLYRSRKTSEKNLERQRKQATIEAYNVLQEQALDILNTKYTDKDVKAISENCQRDSEARQEYNAIGTLLSRCEHFAVGIDEDTYDFETLYRLSGRHLWIIYKRFSPVIERKQKRERSAYANFVNLAERLQERAKKDKTTEE